MYKLKETVKKALQGGADHNQLTRSFCIGVYVAFSPFPGAHTLMMIAFKYLFNLHFPTLFIATSINNPWTMIPFFSGDYIFGYWLVHTVLGWHPSWLLSFEKLFGSTSICIWSFLIGGNILGIIAALACYPVAKKIFGRIAAPIETI